MASAVIELNQQTDLGIASKSRIVNFHKDAVPVLKLCDEKNKEATRKCNHFSIRGYVSEVRKTDPKLCYPFTLKDSTGPMHELPPMVVPNFRWWRCISCVPETENDGQTHLKADPSILMVGQSSKVNDACRVRNTEASISIDSNDNKKYSPSSADKQGKGKSHANDVIPVYSVDRRARFNINGITTALHKDSKVGMAEVGPSEGYATHEVGYVIKTNQGEPTNAVIKIVSGPSNLKQGLINLPDLNDCNGEPSFQAYNKAKLSGINNKFCEDDDDYLGAERRKKPKVRLLSELLGLKKAKNPAKRKRKTLSSASPQNAYIELKKVVTQDDGFKSMETGKSVETSAKSESQYGSDPDDVSTEKIFKTLAKRRCKSKDPLLEKRNKKIKVDQRVSSSLFKQKVKHKSSHGKGNCSEDLPKNLDFLTRVSEKNTVLTKKKGTVSQAQKKPTSLVPSTSQIPKECQTTLNVGEAVQNVTENVQKASEYGHYVLGSILNKETDHIRKDRIYLSSSQAEQKDTEGTSIAKTSITFKSTSGSVPLIGNPFVGESNICLTENSSDRKIMMPEGCSSLARHIDMQVSDAIANQKELTNEVRGRIQDIDINSIPSDDKTNEQGAGDDIPMDIVELMAKNQYERHLDDLKDKHVISQPSDLSGTYERLNGNGSYGQQMQYLAPCHFVNMKKPLLTDPRIPLFNEKLGHYTCNNRDSLGLQGLSREKVVYGLFPSPSQSQEHIRPCTAPAVTPNNWNRNLNAVIGQRYPPSLLQVVDSYQKHRGMAPRPQGINDSQHVWQTSRMPFGITGPQMISQSSNVMNKGKMNSQSSRSFLNFQNQHSLNFSKSYNDNGNPECSARSSRDVNEAIPAMHLLSLMQNAAKMQNTDLSLGPQKVMVSPTSSRYPSTKNDGRTTAMKDNSRHPCYCTARPFPVTYQNNGVNIGKTSAGFIGHIPLTLQGQRNIGSTHFAPLSGHHPLRRPMGPPRNKRKATSSMSKPACTDNPVQTMKYSLNLQYGGGVRLNDKTVSLAPDKVICQLNQNPSEFNDLKLIAQYMIGPENLKPKKHVRDGAVRLRANSKRRNIPANMPITSVTITKT